MSLIKSIFNFLPDSIADAIDGIIQKDLMAIRDKLELKNFLKSLDEEISIKCTRLVEDQYITDQETIKNRFRNYNTIEKIFEYWIGMDVNFYCSEEMLNALTSEIVQEDNVANRLKIKALLTSVNERIFHWLSENAQDKQKTILYIARRFDISNSKQLKANEQNEAVIQDDYRTINRISQKLCQKISEVVQNDAVDFEPTLFGVISTKIGKTFSSLMEFSRVSLPNILFLAARGGSGKTTHLKKFQSDIFAASSYEGTNDDLQEKCCYIPFFISLTDMREGENIKQYIIENYPPLGVILNEQKLTAVFAQKNSSICYVVLLDGLNEYHGNTEDLFNEINTIRKNGNVRFIITSRNSLSDINIASNKLSDITEGTVEHISKDQACKYFNIDSFPADYNDKTTDLLTTPFYMKICRELNYDFTNGHNINAGVLMHRYMDYNISKFNDLGEIVIGEVLPYLCYIRYKVDSTNKNDNLTNGEVALTPFDIENIRNIIANFNSNFGENVECKNVIDILLKCNFITKTNKPFVKYNFKHQNIRDIYAAYYVASTAWLILQYADNLRADFGSEIDMYADLRDFSNDVADAVLTYLFEVIKNEYFSTNDSSWAVLHDEDEKLADLRNSDNLVILEILDKISAEEEDNKRYSQKFIEKYESCENLKLKEALANMYIHTLCQLAQYYRLRKIPGIEALKSFEKCLECAENAKEEYISNNKRSSDGYNHIGKCFNSFLEYVLNKLDDMSVVEEAKYSLVAKAMDEIEYANSIMKKCEFAENDIANALLLILKSAWEAYIWYRQKNEIDSRVLHILAVHYVSRAYMAEACLKNSAESLNLMGMIFENDYNVKLHALILKKLNIDVSAFKTFGNDRLKYSYDLYDAASKCSHIVRGYSAQKKAIMLIKHSVCPKGINNVNVEIEMDLNISKRANRSLTDYWCGRYNQDILNNQQLSQIYYQKELNKQNSNMLVKIEMLQFYPIEEVRPSDIKFIKFVRKINFESLNDEFINRLHSNSDLQDKVICIIKCMNKQKTSIETQELLADKFLVTQETVEENLERFLGKLHIFLEKWEEKNANE